ncbi:Homoserine dehydrogenase [Fundidesulfovibrio magnetotacticus]|uniref:Homoserine dehydrogenase n=1 Tax=Fundidesulfovibrio magnetotacticus TaxID=2730080 RepID=A0A6V8LZZ9_9BACT|nr:homoserine dehydrogenase [Fundidesulfovibrio magnetotacticus]GFK93805.1 Homoserine dehydrogenase [Fundidesulfovibrio magnetotacticus]
MSAPVRLGLAGFGTVGQGLAAILAQSADWVARRLGRPVAVTAVAVRDPAKQRAVPLPAGARVVADPLELAHAPDVDIVVELMGGLGKAHELIRASLENGRHVVTANKHLLAERGAELFALAASKGAGLYYEASVCGGIPVVQTLKESLAGNRIQAVTGILNGTSNFILSRMTKKGLSYGTALKKAQKKGFAEADPTLDVGGFDAAHKLALLIRLAYGVHFPLEKLPVTGITAVTPLDIAYAKEFGCEVKLIGQAKMVDGRIMAGVHPMLLSKSYLLAQVQGAFNAVRVVGDAVGAVMLYGQGAGGLPTGSAVLADIMALARDGAAPNNTGFPEKTLPLADILPAEESCGRRYFRFTVEDKPGVLASIAQALGDVGVSIHQVVQKVDPDASDESIVPIVFMTHTASQSQVDQALARIREFPYVKAEPVHMRVL